MRVDDIDGAQPKKPFVHTNVVKEDITGAKPKSIYHERFSNKPDHFCVHDIEGARPRTNMFKTTRVVNPLDPSYTLPSFEEAPFEEPRFIRDSFNVDDIWGTKPKQPRSTKTRQTYEVHDIEGAQSGWKREHVRLLERMRKETRETRPGFLDVRDITDKGFKTKRCTDPLRPVYQVNGQEIRDCPVGTIPKPLFKERNAPFFSLKTDDVAGAKGGSASIFVRLRIHERSQFRSTNNVKDIDGALPNTLKRGLRTKRQTNPLQPKYTFLHGSECSTPPLDKMDLLQGLAHHKNPKLTSSTSSSSHQSTTSRSNQHEVNNTQDHHQPELESFRSFASAADSSRSDSPETQKCQEQQQNSRHVPPKLTRLDKVRFHENPSHSDSQEECSSAGSVDSVLNSTRSAPSSRRSSRRSSRVGSARRRRQGLDARDAAERFQRPASAHPRSSHPHQTSGVATSGEPHSFSSAMNFRVRKAVEKQAEIASVRDLPDW